MVALRKFQSIQLNSIDQDHLDLADYVLLFGILSSKKFYEKHLREYTMSEIGDALGYNGRKRVKANSARKLIVTGVYRASRFSSMCEKLGIDPTQIFAEFNVTVREIKFPYRKVGNKLAVKIKNEVVRRYNES